MAKYIRTEQHYDVKMLTAATHLNIRKPAPTSIGFAVSNAPVRSTLGAYADVGVAVFLRLVVGLLTTLLILVKAKIYTFLAGNVSRSFLYQESSRIGPAWIEKLANPVGWHFLMPIACVVYFLCFRRFTTEESLLVLKTLGIQTSTTSSTYLSTPTTRFIPTSKIQDIFIHEAFIGFEVRYYLAIAVKGEAEVVVVFPKLLPRRNIVEKVWRDARACLFDSKG